MNTMQQVRFFGIFFLLIIVSSLIIQSCFAQEKDNRFALDSLENVVKTGNDVAKASALNQIVVKPVGQKYNVQRSVRNNKWDAPFYFMVAALLVFFSVLIYFLWQWRRNKVQLHNLQNSRQALQREFEKIQKKLESRIDKKSVGLQKQFDDLKENETTLKSELKKAEESNYLKNAFIANMGFDIRTPLSSIIGFSNILETELAVKKSTELYNYAANIEKSGFYLLKMLNNIIDLSSLEANTLELKIAPVLLHELVEEMTGDYTLAAKDKGLIFKVKVDKDLPPVLADRAGLKKVLEQLIDNAIQYTLEGFVTVSCFYDEAHDLAIIEVKDTGVGMDKRQQESIVHSFVTRNEDDESFANSSGVGLKLAGKYLAIMNCQMLINSSIEEGTTVTVQLPCSEISEMVVLKEGDKSTGKPDKIVTATLHDFGKLDFFVVEDDRMNRMILEKILSKEGNVTLSADGDDCLNIIDREAGEKHYFEVMLFDINLPAPWDGIKLMKEIREKYPRYRKIPFIAQTAYAMAGDKERFLKEGFDSYVSKPIDKNELIGVVRQQLELFKN